jgi:phospholipid/cholesterol/gamma-HCH transport system substrate-binding protein
MDNRKLQFRVGVMVFSTGLIAAILILILGERPASFRETYPLYVTFPDAPSVTRDTPVRTSGILIGRVTDVDLLREGGVEVTVGIYEDVSLPANDVCQVKSSLLGDAEVRFLLPPGQKASKQSLAPESRLEGQVAADPIEVVSRLQGSLSQAIGSVSGTSKDLGELIRHVGDVLDRNEQHIDEIITQSNETLAMVKNTAKFSNDLFSDEKFREDLRREVQQLPEMFREARDTVSTLRKTMDNMNHTMGLVDQNLENIKDFTEPLGDNGPGIVNRMNESVDKLNRLMSEMEVFSKAMNSDQGSLGKLVKDDELYEHLNRAARNVDEVSSRLKPIVNDVRIISDNLARHPGSILRDAVKPGNGTKGLPPGPASGKW